MLLRDLQTKFVIQKSHLQFVVLGRFGRLAEVIYDDVEHAFVANAEPILGQKPIDILPVDCHGIQWLPFVFPEWNNNPRLLAGIYNLARHVASDSIAASAARTIIFDLEIPCAPQNSLMRATVSGSEQISMDARGLGVVASGRPNCRLGALVVRRMLIAVNPHLAYFPRELRDHASRAAKGSNA